MTTETLDKLYLELSLLTSAKSKREIELEKAIHQIANSKSWEQQDRLACYYSAILKNDLVLMEKYKTLNKEYIADIKK